MDVTDSNMKTMCQYLESTLNPDPAIRKEAERSLSNVETCAGYPALLIAVINKQDLPMPIRIACSVALKSFVKRNWSHLDESQPDRISEADRNVVKLEVLNLMLQSPDVVRRQLAETITQIGSHDFPDKWPTLMNDLVLKFSCGDLQVINATLLTADSLFKRYSHEMKSDRLWIEIKYVLDNFAAPLLALFQNVTKLALEKAQSNPQPIELKPIYACLTLIAKIFYSLNAQDLPEFFEDNMKLWMDGFQKLLSTNVPCLRAAENDDEEEAGVVEELWSQICDNIAMYAQKYDEEFSQFLPPFVQIVWQLLVSTGSQTRYDSLVSNAVQFLASVCEREQYKALFASGDALSQICERIVVPNIQMRSQDEELFQDNPEEFIRRDIEGSDVDTRRRSAADLVRALCKHFEADVIRIFSAFINQLFTNYSSNTTKFWNQKDAAVYLVETLSSQGRTARLGATKTSQLVDLNDFFKAHIIADLTDSNINNLPVLKAGALKFLVTFRSHLDKNSLVSIALPSCVRLLAAESVVVHSYAAHAIERLISTRDSQTPKLHVITVDQLKPLMTEILQNLFNIFEKTGSAENEYAAKCLMRCCWYLADSVGPFVDVMVPKLTQKITLASKNPSKPFFNHFLFETLCLLIRARFKMDPSDKTTRVFEDALFPPFQDILQQDVQEFMPYVFQVLSLVLDTRPEKSGAPESYRALFPFLLIPALWERQGSVPALVKLIQAFFRVDADHIIATHLNPVLGVFQKLLSAKMFDGESFKIPNALIEYGAFEKIPRETLISLMKLMFTRLMSNKTPRLVKAMIYFVALFIVRFGAKNLIALFDAVQAGIFGMFVQKILLVDLQKIGEKMEKRVCSFGLVALLTEVPEMTLTGTYSTFWPSMLQALVALFELPEEASGEESNLDVDGDESHQGYSAAYSQLIYAAPPEHNPCAELSDDPKIYLAKALRKLSTSGFQRQIATAIGSLEEKPRAYLTQYLGLAEKI